MSVSLPSAIIALLKRQARRLLLLRPAHRAELVAISLEVVTELESRMRMLAPGAYTTQETRVVLSLARAAVDSLGAQMGRRVGDELEALGIEAAAVGRETLLAEIDHWAQEFKGSVRSISRVDLAGDLLDPGLLEYYQSSREFYGADAITRGRRVLAKGAVSGETVSQTTEALKQELEIPGWRSERIVRTEQSFAAHHRQALDIREAYGGEEQAAELWQKSLVSTLDSRTGADSVYVNGQVRDIDKPFTDNEGRVYMTPPNRPNDREVMVMVPRAYVAAHT